MNLLMVGSGKGSWTMRGIQLGAALGARVTSDPQKTDFDWCDVIVLVKRAIVQFGVSAKATGKPIVWDALDFWTQPAQNNLDAPGATAAFRQQMAGVNPTLVIAATQAMAQATGGIYLPHHCRIGLQPTVIRTDVTTVAYDGGEVYLGRWRKAIETECQARGWAFVVNPPDLREADILVAFRDADRDGWICREWKSGVKVVNAIAAGRPLISQPSAARREIPCAGAVIDSVDELSGAFDEWATFERRAPEFAAAVVDAGTYTVDAIAGQYRQMLESVACPA